MDKTITTALLIVISMIMVMMLFNAAYPAVIEGGDAITSMASQAEARMKSQIQIIHAAGELDSGGAWKDANSSGQFEVFMWVKNVGSARIAAPEQADVFFGPESNFTRIPYSSDNSRGYPYWSWSLENDTQWAPGATLRITIHSGITPSAGRYYAKVTVTSGATAEYFLGL